MNIKGKQRILQIQILKITFGFMIPFLLFYKVKKGRKLQHDILRNDPNLKERNIKVKNSNLDPFEEALATSEIETIPNKNKQRKE